MEYSTTIKNKEAGKQFLGMVVWKRQQILFAKFFLKKYKIKKIIKNNHMETIEISQRHMKKMRSIYSWKIKTILKTFPPKNKKNSQTRWLHWEITLNI